MSSVLSFDNKEYIASRDAARDSGYSVDYISKLCRAKKINARLIGKIWFVEKDSLQFFLSHQDRQKTENQKRLSRERRVDYRARQIEQEVSRVKEAFATKVERALHAFFVRVPALAAASVIVLFVYLFLSGAIVLSDVKNSAQRLAIGMEATTHNAFLNTYANTASTLSFVNNLASHDPNAWEALHQKADATVASVKENSEFLGGALGAAAETMEGQTAMHSDILVASANVTFGSLSRAVNSFGNEVYAFALALHDSTVAYVDGVWNRLAFVAPASHEISERPEVNATAPGNASNVPEPASEGMVVVPSAGSSNADAAQVARIQNAFSDKVSVVPSTDGQSGIITPEFRDTKGSDYLYVLVPVAGQSGSEDNTGSKP
jgi:hypothetical protein